MDYGCKRNHHLFKLEGYRCDVVTAEACRQKFKKLKTLAKKQWALDKCGSNLSGLETINPLQQLLHNILEDEHNKQNLNADNEAARQKKDDEMARIEKDLLLTGSTTSSALTDSKSTNSKRS